MIVNDDTVSKALQYLSEDPHPVALARKDVTDAENNSKAAYAAFYLKTEGTVKERESWVESDPVYKQRKSDEGDAIMEFERHRARVRAAEMICEIWRSENANARAAERVR